MAQLARSALVLSVLCVLLLAGTRVDLGGQPAGCESGCCCGVVEGPSCCDEPAGPVMTSACGCGHDGSEFTLDLSKLVAVVRPLAGRAAVPPAGAAAPRACALVQGIRPAPEPPPPRVSSSLQS